MENPTGADHQHQEDEDEPERGRDRHEEIVRQCLAVVVRRHAHHVCDDEPGRDGTGRRLERLTVRGETTMPRRRVDAIVLNLQSPRDSFQHTFIARSASILEFSLRPMQLEPISNVWRRTLVRD